MTQEQKDLLLQDLCSRLPYGVKVLYENEIFDVEHVCPMYEEVKLDIPETWTIGVSEVKPYLFPLDKISGDMWSEYLATCVGGNASFPTLKSFEWCNEHHIDYRDLIPMGLALDATGLNIY